MPQLRILGRGVTSVAIRGGRDQLSHAYYVHLRMRGRTGAVVSYLKNQFESGRKGAGDSSSGTLCRLLESQIQESLWGGQLTDPVYEGYIHPLSTQRSPSIPAGVIRMTTTLTGRLRYGAVLFYIRLYPI